MDKAEEQSAVPPLFVPGILWDKNIPNIYHFVIEMQDRLCYNIECIKL